MFMNRKGWNFKNLASSVGERLTIKAHESFIANCSPVSLALYKPGDRNDQSSTLLKVQQK